MLLILGILRYHVLIQNLELKHLQQILAADQLVTFTEHFKLYALSFQALFYQHDQQDCQEPKSYLLHVLK
jgi:hypothetical protein